MNYYSIQNGNLVYRRRKDNVIISPWGNGLRVQAAPSMPFQENAWALLPQTGLAEIKIQEEEASITCGKVTAVISEFGKIKFFNQKNELILEEYYRTWDRGLDFNKEIDTILMLHMDAREFKQRPGDTFSLTARFTAFDEEHFYGMGQYQQPYFDLKGCTLELAQKNTQASVPFLISSKGYGFLWNNPAVGEVSFAKNITKWELPHTKKLDYYITAGDTPAEIEENYTEVTGRVPMMPDWAMGFWQCKLRYQTQEEVLAVAREYYRRKIPLKVIVIDFFHWPMEGDWTFDTQYWPDPKAMLQELDSMGIKVMVSVWPTVEDESINYREMLEKNLLVQSNLGNNYTMGKVHFYDATNPEAQRFVWDVCKKNYFDKGVSLFWLDEAEPEYTNTDFDLYRYSIGSVAETGNIYPTFYAKGFYDGMKEAGIENPINLIRCAWAGSQRYGALAWSGDVPSTFAQLRNQMYAGLHMGLAGMAWWTCDIGGFHGGDVRDPKFHELLARWFEYGAFCPVMRLHGDREPHTPPLGTTGGGKCWSGAANEVWSYTPELEKIMVKYIELRDKLQPYIALAMKEAHEKGTPVIKPLFYDFPQDCNCFRDNESYLFGHDILVAPILEADIRKREVYLPEGAEWIQLETQITYMGGCIAATDAPIDTIPIFVKRNSMAETILIG
jgi:alpha-D-xyloside xylohydrolase